MGKDVGKGVFRKTFLLNIFARASGLDAAASGSEAQRKSLKDFQGNFINGFPLSSAVRSIDIEPGAEYIAI